MRGGEVTDIRCHPRSRTPLRQVLTCRGGRDACVGAAGPSAGTRSQTRCGPQSPGNPPHCRSCRRLPTAGGGGGSVVMGMGGTGHPRSTALTVLTLLDAAALVSDVGVDGVAPRAPLVAVGVAAVILLQPIAEGWQESAPPWLLPLPLHCAPCPRAVLIAPSLPPPYSPPSHTVSIPLPMRAASHFLSLYRSHCPQPTPVSHHPTPSPPHSPLKRCPHCPHPFPVAPHCPGQRWHSGTCGRGAWWPASAGSAGHAPSCPACHDNWCHWPRCTPAGSLGSTQHRVRAVWAVRAPRPGTVPAPPFFWYRS